LTCGLISNKKVFRFQNIRILWVNLFFLGRRGWIEDERVMFSKKINLDWRLIVITLFWLHISYTPFMMFLFIATILRYRLVHQFKIDHLGSYPCMLIWVLYVKCAKWITCHSNTVTVEGKIFNLVTIVKTSSHKTKHGNYCWRQTLCFGLS
jgi:hypothetical protein